MIFDKQNIFSDQQALLATAVSTNVIDLGPIKTGIVRDIGKGKQIPLLIQVTETFVGATSLTVALQVDDADTFPSPKVVWTSAAIPVADLKAGYVVGPEYITRYTNERFMRLSYTVAGAGSAGKVTAGVTMGNQSNG